MASYFPLNDDIMAKQQCKSKIYKQIRIIVVPRAGKINWPWSRSRSKQRSRHGANWKDFFQGSFMPNINVISLILQKIWAMLKFLWQTEGRTNKPIDGRTNGFLCPSPYFAKVRGQNSVLNNCSVDWEFCMPSSNRLVSSWIHSKIWLKRCILPLINFFLLFNI